MSAITCQLKDSLAIITIDRPERRNALNAQALLELEAALEQAAGARALIITGSDGHFCAGADLTELEDVTFTEHLGLVLDKLARLPIVTIAAIDGSCMGLGMQLAIACDIRVATSESRFAIPVGKLGLMVDRWTLNRVVRTWGEPAARAMILSAAVLTAEDAWRLGFIAEQGDLIAAKEIAERAIPLAPLVQAGSKLGLDLAGVHQGVHGPTPEAVAAYDDAFARAWASEDLIEGRTAFTERRPPQFRGV